MPFTETFIFVDLSSLPLNFSCCPRQGLHSAGLKSRGIPADSWRCTTHQPLLGGAENATPARLCRWENHQLITKLLADQHEMMLNSTIQKHIKSHENWAFHKWGSPKVDGFKHDAKLCRYAQSQPNSGLAYTEFRKEASGTALSDGGPFPSLVEFPKVPPQKIANT